MPRCYLFVAGMVAEPNLWQTHRWRVIAAGVLLGLGAFLILLLVRSHGRLRSARAELLENELSIRMAARAARMGFWTLDLDRDQLWITEEGRMLFGWDKTEPLGFEHFLATLRPEDREPARRGMRRAMNGDDEFEAEHQIVSADGSIRWIATRGRAEFDGNRHPVCLRGVSMDITARKQAMNEASELRRELSHTGRVSLLGQFTTSLAHELGQPLGAILRNADAAEMFLNSAPPDLDEVRAIIADVRKDGERAGAVIDRLRSMLKRRNIEMQTLVLSDIVHEAIGIVRSDARARGITLEIVIASGLPPVPGDRVHLEQVLLNLVANAMDVLDGERNGEQRITVSAYSRDGTQVECAVSDTGPGIAPDRIHSIFDPFTTTKTQGMGMGLPISRNIVEIHGGRLWAENNPDRGVTFRFTLPVSGSET